MKSKFNLGLLAGVLMAAASVSVAAGTDGGGGGFVAPPVSKPGDEKLHPAVQKLVAKLDDVAETARYAADPREPAGQTAAALAEYFRTPD